MPPEPPRARKRFSTAAAALAAVTLSGILLLASGCGYHVAGRANLLPPTIKTIAVPTLNSGLHLETMADVDNAGGDAKTITFTQVPYAAQSASLTSGRVDAIVGSWDFATKSQPVWTWLSGFRVARFFTSVH